MISSPLSSVKFKGAFLAFLLVLAGMHYYTLVSLGADSKTSLIDSALANAILGLACWLISNLLSFYQPKENKYVFVAVWCAVLAVIYIWVTKLVFEGLGIYQNGQNSFFEHSLPVRYIFALLLIGCMAIISVLWYNQQENQELTKRRTEAEKLTKEIELASLREKLQPHFLFNSLNSISSLTVSEPKAARKMVHQLSDFLRGTLRKDDASTDLETELKHLELYLEIEKVRFGHRLRTEITVAEEILDKSLPPMLLQPLVENAIKFGLYDTLEEVIIGVDVVFEAPYLQITITNPFDQATSHGNKGIGFGLATTHRRLQLLFNRTDLLRTEKHKNQFKSTLKIPQI